MFVFSSDCSRLSSSFLMMVSKCVQWHWSFISGPKPSCKRISALTLREISLARSFGRTSHAQSPLQTILCRLASGPAVECGTFDVTRVYRWLPEVCRLNQKRHRQKSSFRNHVCLLWSFLWLRTWFVERQLQSTPSRLNVNALKNP